MNRTMSAFCKRFAFCLLPFALLLSELGCSYRAPQSAPAVASALAPSLAILRHGPGGLSETLTPLKLNWVHILASHADGSVFFDTWTHNLRTNAGVTWQYNNMGGTAAAVANYIAVSSDTGIPSVADTSLASEISTGGLARAAGTPTYTSTASDLGSGSYTSGGTITGSATQTCTLATFNNSCSGSTATVALTGSNTIAGGTALTVTAPGTGCASAPTTATLGSGTATCSGTATLSTVMGIPSFYTMAHTWTASATQTAVQKAGMFNASSSGTMAFENTFTPVTMASGDTLTVTWTVNF